MKLNSSERKDVVGDSFLRLTHSDDRIQRFQVLDELLNDRRSGEESSSVLESSVEQSVKDCEGTGGE